MALLVYIFNKGKYHPLVRPAILTSALGYSMAGLAIAIDVGRPWFIWRIPLGGFPDMGKYNWNSALLEVALCVMAYVIVLWIELSPAFFEKWKDSPKEGLANFSKQGLRDCQQAADLDHRSGRAAADHAPVIAGQPDAAVGAAAPWSVEHAVVCRCCS